MPVGQLIALGVGSPADITQLTLTGLVAATSGPGSSTATGSLSASGLEFDLAGNTVYALPPRYVSIEWYCAIAANLDVSLDGSTWVTLDTNAGGENKQVYVTAVFIRPSAASKVTIKKVRKL